MSHCLGTLLSTFPWKYHASLYETEVCLFINCSHCICNLCAMCVHNGWLSTLVTMKTLWLCLQFSTLDVFLRVVSICCTANVVRGGWNSLLAVFGLAVHGVAGSILLWGKFPVEGIFPLELTWVQTRDVNLPLFGGISLFFGLSAFFQMIFRFFWQIA